MEKIVNNDGYLRSGLMDIARQLLNVCSETGVSNIQIVTSPWKEGKGISNQHNSVHNVGCIPYDAN